MASRQRDYQRRHVARGLCQLCREKIARSNLCARHYEAHAIWKRNDYRRRNGMDPRFEPVKPNSRRSA